MRSPSWLASCTQWSGSPTPSAAGSFSEALGFTFAGDFDIVRDAQLEATNYFFSIGDQENVFEQTYNHDGRTYEMGTAYGHAAIGVDDLDARSPS